MSIHRSTKGPAIVNDTVVPGAEMRLLDALAKYKGECTAPELIRSMSLKQSDATAYSLLRRLEKRQMITSRVIVIKVLGTDLKRIVWSVHPKALSAFEDEQNQAFLKSLRDSLEV
jgi:DNA-binding MarR family transcriptional regulator